MAYSVNYEPEAVTDLDQLTQTTRVRILKKIEWLKNNFDQISPLPLTGNFSGFYKLRIGDYRVIYEFDKRIKLFMSTESGIVEKFIKNNRDRLTLVFKKNTDHFPLKLLIQAKDHENSDHEQRKGKTAIALVNPYNLKYPQTPKET